MHLQNRVWNYKDNAFTKEHDVGTSLLPVEHGHGFLLQDPHRERRDAVTDASKK
jgi:hypothetical protein